MDYRRFATQGRPGDERSIHGSYRVSPLFLISQAWFRSRFRLGEKEAEYLKAKGLEVIIDHARDFVAKRLADAQPANDGRQTPMKNHPVFIAQHATATCRGKCLAKWHHIPRARALTRSEIDYIVAVLERWLVENLS